jgi:hypothetical protein
LPVDVSGVFTVIFADFPITLQPVITLLAKGC